MITIYGIKNCDTMKKAIKWLESIGQDYIFHDYRKEGLNETTLKTWVDQFGLDVILNKRGTTWRKLPDDVKENINQSSALQIMLENPAMIKRPIFVVANETIVGFSVKEQTALENILRN